MSKRKRKRSCLATVEIESDSLLHLGFKLAVAATAAVAIFTEKNIFTVNKPEPRSFCKFIKMYGANLFSEGS